MQNISRYKSFGKFVPIMLFMRRWSDKKKRRGNKINRLHSFIMHCRGSRKKQKKWEIGKLLISECVGLHLC